MNLLWGITLSGAKSVNSQKGESVSLMIKKYQVVVTRTHSGFL
jgi:hypothetical protein